VLRIRDVFIPDPKSGSDNFHIADPGSKHFFILDPGSYIKSGMQTYFFVASYGFRSKVIVLVIVKKIRLPEKIHPDPDPEIQGLKKHRIRIRNTV
jgi:hypothetical protein